ncbi:hypothetical protein SETIT_2G440000v2 [Setaria italica]|uniref:IBH1-like N-terminal domain-containing protein n=2 Tax=Setaria TaxID=4554 RepID=A0A368Q9F7_SETIT|nr:transcription factor bHLH149-like isoform X2 [Setaria italica]RCV14621.1 hypothetical protein SETIT_2G440000v2 [Setaria italica]TKW36628.1 hypothetical protein SEVIR_2G452400v2 [Setaria viridis]
MLQQDVDRDHRDEMKTSSGDLSRRSRPERLQTTLHVLQWHPIGKKHARAWVHLPPFICPRPTKASIHSPRPSPPAMSTSSAGDSGGRKRKRDSDADADQQDPPSKWRQPRAQQAYSSKLLDALRLVRSGGASSSGREVRDAAYRALAVAARGRSRWSRAILARRGRPLQRARLVPRAPPTGTSSSSRPGSLLASKTRALGRLVPGCRRMSLPALLAEVSDYIAALQMQLRSTAN